MKGTSLRESKKGDKLTHRDLPRTLRPSYRKKHKSNVDYGSRTDPEASFIGRPGKGAFFSYKYHFTVDGHGRVITSVVVTPGAVVEEHILEELLEKQPVNIDEVCADSQYGTAWNYALCWKRGIKPSIPRRRTVRRKHRIPQGKFKYSPEKDVYICPNGKELRRVTYDKRTSRWHYRPRNRDCKVCPLKSLCCPQTPIRTFVRAVEQEYVDKTLEWLRTAESRKSIKERKTFAEWAVAEAKTLHGLDRAKCRGLQKAAIQGLMIATVQNIKRLIAIQNGTKRRISLIFEFLVYSFRDIHPSRCMLSASRTD